MAPRRIRDPGGRVPATAVAAVLQVVERHLDLLDVVPDLLRRRVLGLESLLDAEELMRDALAVEVHPRRLLEVEGPEHLRGQLELAVELPPEDHLHRRALVVRRGHALEADLELPARPVGVVPVALDEGREHEPARPRLEGVVPLRHVRVVVVGHSVELGDLVVEVPPQARLDEVGLPLQRADVAHHPEVAREDMVPDEVLVRHLERRRRAVLHLVVARLVPPGVPVVHVDRDLDEEPDAAVVEPAGLRELPAAASVVEGRVPAAEDAVRAVPVPRELDAVVHDRLRVVVEDARLGDGALGLPHHVLVGLARGGEDAVHGADVDARVPDVHGVAADVRPDAVLDEVPQPRKDRGRRHCCRRGRGRLSNPFFIWAKGSSDQINKGSLDECWRW